MIQFLQNNKEVIKLILNGVEVLIIPILAFFLTKAFTKKNKAEENLNETKR
jgi:hypothetical protein